MVVLFIAETLGKFPSEVEALYTSSDLAEFLAYKKIVADEKDKEYKRQELLRKR